MKDDAV